MTHNEKTRLDRIEDKIDLMADAIVAIARAEEKLSNLDNNASILLKRLIEQDERLRIVEKNAGQLQTKVDGIMKIFWTIGTTIITAITAGLIWFGGKGE